MLYGIFSIHSHFLENFPVSAWTLKSMRSKNGEKKYLVHLRVQVQMRLSEKSEPGVSVAVTVYRVHNTRETAKNI